MGPDLRRGPDERASDSGCRERTNHAHGFQIGTRFLAAGGLVFGVLYGARWLAWRHDQNLVGVVRAAVRYRSRYEAGLLEDRSPN